jgi:hypothetical protein
VHGLAIAIVSACALIVGLQVGDAVSRVTRAAFSTRDALTCVCGVSCITIRTLVQIVKPGAYFGNLPLQDVIQEA